jgi:hypothetical protein
MSDIESRLRTQLPEIGEEIQPSPHMPSRVETRIRRRRALTVGALSAVAVALVLTATAVVGTLGGDALDPAQGETTPGPSEGGSLEEGAGARLERIEARREAADAAAQALVEELGRLCANFDFFFKHDMANGAFRPVRCSLSGRDETVLFAYGFDTAQTRQAWGSEWGNLAAQRGASLVESGTWAVEVLDSSIVEEVRSVVLGSP